MFTASCAAAPTADFKNRQRRRELSQITRDGGRRKSKIGVTVRAAA